MIPIRLCLLLVLAAPALFVHALEIANPTKTSYEQALVRLNPDRPLPAEVDSVVATRDGVAVPAQIEATPEGGIVWVAVDLQPGERADYRLRSSSGPVKRTPLVAKKNGNILLRNDRMQVVVPGSWNRGGPLPAPIRAFRTESGDWRGRGEWLAHPDATGFSSRVMANGPLFAQVRLRYEFGDHWAEVDIRLPPGKAYARIRSRHSMREGDGWRLSLTEGWNARQGVMRRWYKGQFDAAPSEERFELKPGKTRLGDTVIHLQPRWTQSYDEGWSFGAANQDFYAGALVLRAGQWRWPHDNKPRARVRESGDWATVDLPTHRGARTWLLLAGDAKLAGRVPNILKRENVLNADKLTHRYRLPFDPGEKKLIGGVNFYSNDTNPTGIMRRQNKRKVSDAEKGKTAMSLRTLYKAQAVFDPDWYGYMEHGWSPINPNFHTDFMKGGVALAAQLRNHPEFPHLRKLAEEAFRRDMVFAITLPGGAGQECPGYQQHAMSSWKDLAPICAKYLGFDPREWPRYREGARFLAKISIPSGGRRKFHPAGDTHPNRPSPLGWAKKYGASENPRRWTSEEFPGFGAVLRHRSGTSEETYLSFKSGPNRGHYHGDQLSIHWVAQGRSLAVDHHASYNPRPGQEHMHNRLSFSVDGMPYANMDGHERLIAFRAGEVADVAVGQVSSSRVREVKKLPPEDWDVEFPQKELATPLVYRRTLVLWKGDPDMVVMVDDYTGPEVTATWNLHVRGDRAERKGDWIDFGNARAFVASAPGETYEALSWSHSNGGREKTTAARISREGASGRFISVLIPGDTHVPVEWTGNALSVEGRGRLVFRPDGGIQLHSRAGGPKNLLAAGDIDPDRSQGEAGLFVPDVGYPFGPLPQWLIDQRTPAPGL